MTIDTKAFVPIARPDITARLPERPAQEVRPADSLRGDPILNEAFVKLTVGWRSLTTWVLITNITDESILIPGVMHAHEAFVDLRRHVL